MKKVGLTEARKKANAKWDAQNLKRFSLAIPIELFNSIEEHTAVTNESRNGFIRRAITETMTRDNQVPRAGE